MKGLHSHRAAKYHRGPWANIKLAEHFSEYPAPSKCSVKYLLIVIPKSLNRRKKPNNLHRTWGIDSFKVIQPLNTEADGWEPA